MSGSRVRRQIVVATRHYDGLLHYFERAVEINFKDCAGSNAVERIVRAGCQPLETAKFFGACFQSGRDESEFAVRRKPADL